VLRELERRRAEACVLERELFIGTQYSNLYTTVDYYCSTYYKVVRVGRGIVEDMC
jgi:hypothetical protein